MNINDVYQSSSSFLRASDLQGNTIKLVIEAIGTHTFNEGKPDQKTQIVLAFQGKEKKLGLNATRRELDCTRFRVPRAESGQLGLW